MKSYFNFFDIIMCFNWVNCCVVVGSRLVFNLFRSLGDEFKIEDVILFKSNCKGY